MPGSSSQELEFGSSEFVHIYQGFFQISLTVVRKKTRSVAAYHAQVNRVSQLH